MVGIMVSSKRHVIIVAVQGRNRSLCRAGTLQNPCVVFRIAHPPDVCLGLSLGAETLQEAQEAPCDGVSGPAMIDLVDHDREKPGLKGLVDHGVVPLGQLGQLVLGFAEAVLKLRGATGLVFVMFSLLNVHGNTIVHDV
jgi:hypothetical protein